MIIQKWDFAKKIITLLFLLFIFNNYIFSQSKNSVQSIYPYFPSCENQNLSSAEIIECSEKAILNLLNNNIKYPSALLKNNPNPKAWVRFHFEEDGTPISRFTHNHQNESDSLLTSEVFRVLSEMPKWIVNESTIKPMYPNYSVKVAYNIDSFKFKIERRSKTILVENLRIKIENENKIAAEKKKRHEAYFKRRKASNSPIGKQPSDNIRIKPYMPRFPGCEDKGITNKKNLEKCSQEQMLKFFYDNIKYPRKAREENTEGTVIAQFIVRKDGSIGHIEIIQDIGNGCGKEVQRIISSMPRFTPGPSRGLSMTVKFTVAVFFNLVSENKPDTDYENLNHSELEKKWPWIYVVGHRPK